MVARSDGSVPISSSSLVSRSAGMAQISLCTTAFTSSHQASPFPLAPARSATLSSSGIMRSDFT